MSLQLAPAGLVVLLVTVTTTIGDVEKGLNLGLQACGDQNCRVALSEGRTLLSYNDGAKPMLNFEIDQPVTVFSKGDGNLWGVEISGTRGLVDKRHIEELQVFVKDPKFYPGQKKEVNPNASVQVNSLDASREGQGEPQPHEASRERTTFPDAAAAAEGNKSAEGLAEPAMTATGNLGVQDPAEASEISKPPAAGVQSPQPAVRDAHRNVVEKEPQLLKALLPESRKELLDNLEWASKLVLTTSGRVIKDVQETAPKHDPVMAPEDMEFNRIKATYTTAQGNYVLSSSLPDVLPVAPSTEPEVEASTVAAPAVKEKEQDFEVVNGTNIPSTGDELEPSIKPPAVSTGDVRMSANESLVASEAATKPQLLTEPLPQHVHSVADSTPSSSGSSIQPSSVVDVSSLSPIVKEEVVSDDDEEEDEDEEVDSEEAKQHRKKVVQENLESLASTATATKSEKEAEISTENPQPDSWETFATNSSSENEEDISTTTTTQPTSIHEDAVLPPDLPNGGGIRFHEPGDFHQDVSAAANAPKEDAKEIPQTSQQKSDETKTETSAEVQSEKLPSGGDGDLVDASSETEVAVNDQETDGEKVVEDINLVHTESKLEQQEGSHETGPVLNPHSADQPSEASGNVGYSHDSVQRHPKDPSHEAPQDAPENTIQDDASQTNPQVQDNQQQTSQDDLQSVFQNATPDVIQEIHQDAFQVQNASRDISQDDFHRASQETSQDVYQGVVHNALHGALQDTSGEPHLFQSDVSTLASEDSQSDKLEEVSLDSSPEDLGDDLNAQLENLMSEPEVGSLWEDTVKHYIEATRDLVPEWLHKSFHWNSVDGISPRFTALMATISFTFVALHLIHLLTNKMSNEKPLLAKVSTLDKQLFKAKNEMLIIKREMDELRSKKSNEIRPSDQTTVVDGGIQQPSAHAIKELESLRGKVATLTSLNAEAANAKQRLSDQLTDMTEKHDAVLSELAEAESVVQECLRDKEKQQLAADANEDFAKAVDTLRDQLHGQKDAVKKYEARVRKRELELKEKIKEVRLLTAESANARLEVEKVTKDRNNIKKMLEEIEKKERESLENISQLELKVDRLESVKRDVVNLRDELDVKESELESKSSEVEALQETIQTLETIIKTTSPPTNGRKTNDSSEEGWEGFDDDDVVDEEQGVVTNINVVHEMSVLKVDLRKAQSACEALTNQLTGTELEAKETKETLSRVNEELDVSRQAKDQALKDKLELEQKHSVLSHYFNQRNSELQKQLGLQMARLGDAEQGSESTAKKLNELHEELDASRLECKNLKLELEEQERSLRGQLRNMEKKQHESWVTVRQEGRKMADVQNDMQTLRNRLTVAETKLVEKDVEIGRCEQENQALKDVLETIQQSSGKCDGVYANGNGLHGSESYANTSGSMLDSGGGDANAPPPDLPDLPPLPPAMGYEMPPPPPHHPMDPMHSMYYPPPAMMSAYQGNAVTAAAVAAAAVPVMYPSDMRPAPLGKRSPPPAPQGSSRRSAHNYSPPNGSRSPSPLPYRGGGGQRDISDSEARSESRMRYDSYGGPTGSEYDSSAAYHAGSGRRSINNRPRRRRTSREHSYSSRSEQSEFSDDDGSHRRRRRGDASDYETYTQRGPASSRSGASRRTGNLKDGDRQGPKTSSPMVDSYS